MWMLWVLAVLLAILAVLLSLSLAVQIRYDETLTVRLGYGPLRFTVLPHPKPKKKPKRKKAGAATEKKAKKPENAEKEKGFWETISLVLTLIKAIAGPAGKLLRRIRITRLDALVVVAGTDAAATAERYGKMSAAVYGSVTALKNLIRVGVKSLFVGYDFKTDDDLWRVSLTIKIRGIFLLTTGVRALWRVLFALLKQNPPDEPRPKKAKQERKDTTNE